MTSVFEEKSIPKAILRVGFPAMLGQLTTLVYNLADTFFVSMTQDANMVAAVTLCAPILLIIMSIAAVFGAGGASLIARLLGEGDRNYAGRTLNFCVYATVIAGILALAIGLIFLNPIAQISGAETANFDFTCDYLLYIFLGGPFIMLSNGYVTLFRSVGKIRESAIGLILGNAVNIVLDYIFIILLDGGTAGAALATSLGFFCSTVYFLVCSFRESKKGNKLFLLSPKEFHPDKAMVRDVVTIGIPGALITVLMSVANIVLNNYIAMYGSDAVASYGIAYKIDSVPIMLSVGLAQGIAPLVGYYYGAKEEKRMASVVRYSILYGVLLGLVFTVTFLLLANRLAALFLHETALIQQSGLFLKILCLSAPMVGVINIVTSYFQALGKAAQSLLITVLRNAALFIPAVILLNRVWQLNGVIAAQPMVETTVCVFCLALYGVQSGTDRRVTRFSHRRSCGESSCRR